MNQPGMMFQRLFAPNNSPWTAFAPHGKPALPGDPPPKSRLAKLLFRSSEMRVAIRKRFVAEVDDDGFLVPQSIRRDDSDGAYYTNAVERGETYEVGLLLDEPRGNWNNPKWQAKNVAQFHGYVNSRSHITIPREICDAYGISEGDQAYAVIACRVFHIEHENQSYVPEAKSLSQSE